MSLVGIVALIGREELAAATLDGRTLLDLAVDAVGSVCSRVLVVAPPGDRRSLSTPVDWLSAESDVDLREAVASYDRVLLHDLACPGTPATFLNDVASAAGPATVSVTALTDTVKEMDGDRVAHTVARDRVRVVASPVGVDRDVFLEIRDLLGVLRDPAALVETLRSVAVVTLMTAPGAGRAVSDRDDLRLLELRRLA
jgi:2-C-methyl-D-erythritol 4-phosphate cytidylyltransferase